MASTKTYAGPTKEAALREAALDLGLDVSEIEIAEIVVRRNSAGVEETRVEVKVRSAPPEDGSAEGPAIAPPPAPSPAREMERASQPTPASDGASPEALAPRAEAFLRELLGRMDIVARLDIDRDADNVYIDIVGEAGVGGLLIGRQGQTLDQLQYLVNRVVLPGAAAHGRIYLDTEGYRAKYRRKLEDLARKYRDDVVRTGRPVTLDELSARDRWIIHQALFDDARVTTRSEGDDRDRKLMIIPR